MQQQDDMNYDARMRGRMVVAASKPDRFQGASTIREDNIVPCLCLGKMEYMQSLIRQLILRATKTSTAPAAVLIDVLPAGDGCGASTQRRVEYPWISAKTRRRRKPVLGSPETLTHSHSPHLPHCTATFAASAQFSASHCIHTITCRHSLSWCCRISSQSAAVAAQRRNNRSKPWLLR